MSASRVRPGRPRSGVAGARARFGLTLAAVAAAASFAIPAVAVSAQEAVTRVGAREVPEHLLDQVGPAEEVQGVGLFEGPQALVGVGPRGVGPPADAREGADDEADERRHG